MDGAWKLVKLDAAGASRFTLEQIVAAGVSRAQVTFMRKVLREVEDGFECLRWKDALNAHSKKVKRDYSEEEIEDMMNAEAEAAADKFARVIGTRLSDRPAVFARMIEIYSGRRIDEVIEILNQRNRSGDDDVAMPWDEDGENPDF